MKFGNSNSNIPGFGRSRRFKISENGYIQPEITGHDWEIRIGLTDSGILIISNTGFTQSNLSKIFLKETRSRRTKWSMDHGTKMDHVNVIKLYMQFVYYL